MYLKLDEQIIETVYIIHMCICMHTSSISEIKNLKAIAEKEILLKKR